ncbi:hypothetical protein A0H81_13242 [Grifola frondosa]|uniref:Uncharacterized protein n=1 Tax=Grifola frondosa TaxID=5627 RepID=A0A1C7LRS7_GRIFR|nr:hypothetical protein A0H81_13242 [Grifola frondosa]
MKMASGRGKESNFGVSETTRRGAALCVYRTVWCSCSVENAIGRHPPFIGRCEVSGLPGAKYTASHGTSTGHAGLDISNSPKRTPESRPSHKSGYDVHIAVLHPC